MGDRDYQSAFTPVPDRVHQSVLHALGEIKAKRPARRRLSVILAVTLPTLLLLTAAAVATNQWGVLDYLFGGIQNADEKTLEKVWAVGESKTALGVTVTMDSILLDGKRIAAGWVFENSRPGEPAYIVTDAPTAGGKHIIIDSNDGVAYTWLPDPYKSHIHPDSTAKGGFTGEIRGGLPEGPFDIILRISVFRPVQPIIVLREEDYTNKFGQVDYSLTKPVVWEMSRKGYLVVNEYGDVQLTLPQWEKTGEVFVGGLPDEIEAMGKFEREDMELVIHMEDVN